MKRTKSTVSASNVVPLRAVGRRMKEDSAEVLAALFSRAKRNQIAGMLLTYIEADGSEHTLVTGSISEDIDKALVIATRAKFRLTRVSAARLDGLDEL